MDKENILNKMEIIHLQIWMAHKYIQAKLTEEPGFFFSFIEKTKNISDLDTFFSWQLEINIEMVFVKVGVFLELLEELEISNDYKIDKKFINAGLRAYVAHKGTHKDFKTLCLPVNLMVVADRIKVKDDQIFFTLLSGNHTEKLSTATTHEINLTEKIFKPHFDFIKEKYPNWLV